MVATTGDKRVYDGFVKVDKGENGFEKVVTTDSVAVLIYDPSSRNVILTSQTRFPMLDHYPLMEGFIEAVAGRLDIHFYGVRATISKEIKEEVGISVGITQIEIIGQQLATSPGVLTERMWLAYVELKPGQLDTNHNAKFGNSEENEETSRVLVHVDDLERFADQHLGDLKTWALIQWFLRNKANRNGEGSE